MKQEMEEGEEDDMFDNSPLFRALSLGVLSILRRRKQVLSFSNLHHNRDSGWRRITFLKRETEEGEEDNFHGGSPLTLDFTR